MKIKLILVLILALFLSAALAGVFILKHKTVEKVHYHAGFVVFKDGKQENFSDFKYMEIKPCNINEDEDKDVEEDEQTEKAHLHDQVGDVVHVETVNSKWNDLFMNLNYKFDYKKAIVYLNGEKVNNFQDLGIKPYDSLVVMIGKNDEKTTLSKAVKKSHIQDVEKRSENCGT